MEFGSGDISNFTRDVFLDIFQILGNVLVKSFKVTDVLLRYFQNERDREIVSLQYNVLEIIAGGDI